MSEFLACLVQCLYLHAGVAVFDRPPAFYDPGLPQQPAFRLSMPYDRMLIRNPYITSAGGWEGNVSPRLRAYLELGHESSSATTRDWGQNYVRAGVKWFPFGGVR